MLIAIFTYHYRPFKQALMVPDGYEGVITISYDDPDGQPIRSRGGFLGIGVEYLIDLGEDGSARTQLTYPGNSIPLFNLPQRTDIRNGLSIYYTSQPGVAVIDCADAPFNTFNGAQDGNPSLYLPFVDNYPSTMLVLVQPEDYCKYFEARKHRPNDAYGPPDDQILSDDCVRPLTHALLPVYREFWADKISH